MSYLNNQANQVNARDSKGDVQVPLLGGSTKQPPATTTTTTSGGNKIEIESYKIMDIFAQLYLANDFQSIDNWINSGVSVNSQNTEGLSLLHLASSRGHSIYVRYLLSKGANPNLQTLQQTTPLHLATTLDTACALISAGACVNAVDEEGETPAHYCIRESRLDTLALLLSNNADTCLSNDDGESPLHLAASLGEEKACQLLIAAGADIRLRDSNGSTPLAEAKLNGHVPIVQLLSRCGVPAAPSPSSLPYRSFKEIEIGTTHATSNTYSSIYF
eukprot:gene6183-7161_t